MNYIGNYITLNIGKSRQPFAKENQRNTQSFRECQVGDIDLLGSSSNRPFATQPIAMAWKVLIVCAMVAVHPGSVLSREQSYDHEYQYSALQQPTNGESISEHFYDEIRQLLNRKYEENAGLEPAGLYATAKRASANSKSDESTNEGSQGNSIIDTSHLDSPPKPKLVANWPQNDLKLGQVTAVSIHPDGNPVVFHRADRVWDEK